MKHIQFISLLTLSIVYIRFGLGGQTLAFVKTFPFRLKVELSSSPDRKDLYIECEEYRNVGLPESRNGWWSI